ncbi:MAG TPA: YetF domain-containing protein [Chloroflexota bacterium]|nr:YetF domain-containing protein [Chloroflexota bacterium]
MGASAMDMNALSEIIQNLFIPGTNVVEKVIRPIVVYFFLVLLLRLGGRRELAQMNAFDLVVLLMLSNSVQNAIIGEDNSLAGGLLGGFTLIAINFLTNRYLYRHPNLDRKIEGDTVVLVKDGRVMQKSLERELITEAELLAAVHRQGVLSIEDCDSVILEVGGTISVIPREPTAGQQVTRDIVDRLERIERLLTAPR